jgi:hypothetical protein
LQLKKELAALKKQEEERKAKKKAALAAFQGPALPCSLVSSQYLELITAFLCSANIKK